MNDLQNSMTKPPVREHITGINFRAAYALLIKAYVRSHSTHVSVKKDLKQEEDTNHE